MNLRLAIAVVAALVAVAPSTALAAPPPNDAFADATAVGTLPFSDSQSLSEASVEPGEPQTCSVWPQSIWYRVAPAASGVLSAELSSGTAVLGLYRQTGADISTLALSGCSPFPFGRVTAPVDASETYYLQARSTFLPVGPISISIRLIPPPRNDDLAQATTIGSLPFFDSEDILGATFEAGEPGPSCFPPTTSVWYAYHAPATGSVTARATSMGFAAGRLTVYTGSSLASLQEVACRSGVLTFHADAGQTYYVQAAPPPPGFCSFCTALSFSLDVTPPPVASFWLNPWDPTIFDTVQFCDVSWDPGEVGFASFRFDFGDGGSADGPCPTHHYAADGDYTVGETVTTMDGRTASATSQVHVRTHDVAITKLTVPQSASSGQTRSITVGVSSTRYAERVRVVLYRSLVGSDPVPFAELTQDVPVRSANRTTAFAFSYTFTNDDATAGKVTFKADATVEGARDALPADNTATALPTKVSR